MARVGLRPMFVFFLSTVPVSGVAVPYGSDSESSVIQEKGGGTEAQTARVILGQGDLFTTKDLLPGRVLE